MAISAVEQLLMQSSNDDKTVTFKMPELERDKLTDLCEKNGINRNQLILAAVRDVMVTLQAPETIE